MKRSIVHPKQSTAGWSSRYGIVAALALLFWLSASAASEPNDTGDWIAFGEQPGAAFGTFAASAGDVNGEG
ncbi:MAG: hypothetical protein L0Z50_34545 [Verrucomicrobiales bacterium]|nr:hypothetical protein [Verrucomicrobiales bacterium]